MARYLGVEPVHTSPFYFLSYNSEDYLRVKDYAMALAAKNVPFWYDKGIQAGEEWEEVIATHIRDCEAMVVFLTRGIFKKRKSFVRKEFNLAQDNEKRIIIVRLDQIEKDDIPPRYAFWWSDITDMQCIHAWDYASADDCAGHIAQELGIAAGPEIKTIRYDNGAVYEGAVLNGKPNGRGKKTWASGDVYEGDWADGQVTGRGKYTWADGEVYEGDWVDDKRHGKGRDAYANGDVYEGDWVDDKRTGKGKYTFANGEVYEGDYVDGKRHGKGMCAYTSGNVYEGDWVDGKRHGKCKYTFANGNVYEGDFTDDKRTGRGRTTYANGDVYEGDWVDDTHTGKGKYIWASGNVYEGDFVNGLSHGWGTLTSAKGRVLKKGRWKDDKFIG